MIAKAKFGVNPALRQLARGGGPIVDSARKSLRKGADFWHKQILPGHFEPGASKKYAGAYTPRTNRHIRRKARRGSAAGPQRFTGTHRQQTLKSRPDIKDARGKKALRVRLKLKTGRAANLWTGRRVVKSTGQRHDFARELTAMRLKDVIAVERVISQDLDRRLGPALAKAGRGIRTRKV